MKKILYILLPALLFVGCESSFDMGTDNPSPDNPNIPKDPDVPEGDLPSQPIKRRPISPQDKTLRPRFRVLNSTTFELSFELDCRPACCSVTLRSDSTGEEYTHLLWDDDLSVALPVMENTKEYTLVIEGEDTYYVEKIIL